MMTLGFAVGGKKNHPDKDTNFVSQLQAEFEKLSHFDTSYSHTVNDQAILIFSAEQNNASIKTIKLIESL